MTWAYGADIFIYNINVNVLSGTGEAKTDEQAIDRLSRIFQKSFSEFSSETISYKAVNQEPSTQITGTVRTISNTVNALAVCFFYDIEFILYGDILIEKDKSQYTAHLKVYSKSQNDVVYELKYAKAVLGGNEEKFAKELAEIVQFQLPNTINSLPLPPAQKRLRKLEEKIAESEAVKKEKEAEEAEKSEKNNDKIISYMEKIMDKLEKKGDQPAKTGEKANEQKTEEKSAIGISANTEKIFSFYIGGGLYFNFLGTWKDVTIPLISIQTGPKLHLLLVNSDSFDLYLRPGLYVDYSVAIQKEDSTYNRYIQIHSLAGAIGLEFCFEFGDLFGISIGGGGQYNFDFIEFRESVTYDYYAYTSHALGAFGNVGIEFILGNEKNIILGINNIIRFVFYDELYLDYRILLCATFKV